MSNHAVGLLAAIVMISLEHLRAPVLGAVYLLALFFRRIRLLMASLCQMPLHADGFTRHCVFTKRSSESQPSVTEEQIAEYNSPDICRAPRWTMNNKQIEHPYRERNALCNNNSSNKKRHHRQQHQPQQQQQPDNTSPPTTRQADNMRLQKHYVTLPVKASR